MSSESQAQRSWFSVVGLIAYLTCVFVLFIYAIRHDDPLLIFPGYGGLLILSFALLLGSWVRIAGKQLLKRQQSASKPMFAVLVMLGVGLLGAYVGAFHGVAKLLHHLENQPGEVMATVSGKYPYTSRAPRCTRIRFQEFR